MSPGAHKKAECVRHDDEIDEFESFNGVFTVDHLLLSTCSSMYVCSSCSYHSFKFLFEFFKRYDNSSAATVDCS
jgi:hypothetical protein